MTEADFREQMRRLRVRFTDRNFDAEFVQLVWSEVHDMSAHSFKRFCDVLIGSRTANKPPLLSEFREARLAEQKRAFDNQLKAATNTMRKAPDEMRKHMRSVLATDYGAVDSVSDALEIAKLRNKLNNPDGAA